MRLVEPPVAKCATMVFTRTRALIRTLHVKGRELGSAAFNVTRTNLFRDGVICGVEE